MFRENQTGGTGMSIFVFGIATTHRITDSNHLFLNPTDTIKTRPGQKPRAR